MRRGTKAKEKRKEREKEGFIILVRSIGKEEEWRSKGNALEGLREAEKSNNSCEEKGEKKSIIPDAAKDEADQGCCDDKQIADNLSGIRE